MSCLRHVTFLRPSARTRRRYLSERCPLRSPFGLGHVTSPSGLPCDGAKTQTPAPPQGLRRLSLTPRGRRGMNDADAPRGRRGICVSCALGHGRRGAQALRLSLPRSPLLVPDRRPPKPLLRQSVPPIASAVQVLVQGPISWLVLAEGQVRVVLGGVLQNVLGLRKLELPLPTSLIRFARWPRLRCCRCSQPNSVTGRLRAVHRRNGAGCGGGGVVVVCVGGARSGHRRHRRWLRAWLCGFLCPAMTRRQRRHWLCGFVEVHRGLAMTAILHRR